MTIQKKLVLINKETNQILWPIPFLYLSKQQNKNHYDCLPRLLSHLLLGKYIASNFYHLPKTQNASSIKKKKKISKL